jgi:hypothetical protein
MTARAHDTTTTITAAARPARRADAGSIRLSQRDIDGLLLAGEHYGVPLDLLAAALRVPPGRLPAITARWRRAGYATGRPAGARAGLVLADPGRDDRYWPAVPCYPSVPGTPRAHPGGAGCPAVAAGRRGLAR